MTHTNDCGQPYRTMVAGKIHRATVTAADVDYVGSISIDSDLLEAANMLPGEQVDVVDVTNGARLTTYTIASPAGSGEIQLHGAAARLVHEGDLVIIIAYIGLPEGKARTHKPSVVHVDENNRQISLGEALDR